MCFYFIDNWLTIRNFYTLQNYLLYILSKAENQAQSVTTSGDY